jgi:pentapeptide MXKDX repeat protein
MSTLFLLLVVIIVLLSLIRIQQISDDILKASGLRNVFVARETSGADVSLRMAEFFNMKQKQALELKKKSDTLRKNSEALREEAQTLQTEAETLRKESEALLKESETLPDVKQIMSILTISGSVAEKVVEDWVASQIRRCKRICEEDALNAFTTDAFVKDAFTTDAFVKDALTTDALTTDALTTDALTTDALTTDALTTDAMNAFINDEKEDILAKTL